MSSKRHEFSQKTKVLAWDRSRGFCENCGNEIREGNGPEYDHIVPAAIGGSNDLENCQVLCRKPCHSVKTTETDVPAIAKTKRVRNRHINAEPKRRGFRGSRKFNGEIRWNK